MGKQSRVAASRILLTFIFYVYVIQRHNVAVGTRFCPTCQNLMLHKEQRSMKKIFLYCQQCKKISSTTETRFKKEIINNFNTERIENGQTRPTENSNSDNNGTRNNNQQDIELSPDLVSSVVPLHHILFSNVFLYFM
jgi:DNA-directed RNA polymerase subunit M/transcription elongation factor TFIIS